MKKNALTYSLILLILLFVSLPSRAQGDNTYRPIQTVVPFLTIAPDSRAGALGDVGAATTPDLYSMHWNPAKYAFIDGNGGFGISYIPWLRALVPDMNMASLNGYYRIDKLQVVAASLLYMNLGSIRFMDVYGNEIREYIPNEFSFDLAYSRLLSEHWSGSVAMRLIFSNITGGITIDDTDTKPGIAYAADVSAFYTNRLDLGSRSGNISAGINFSNIGSKISYTNDMDPDFIPMNMRLGSTFSVDLDNYNTFCFSVDINKLLVPTPPIYDNEIDRNIIAGKDPNVSVPVAIFQSFYDAPDGFKEELREFTQSIGVEYWYNRQFALRAGFFNEAQSKGNRKYFTAGAGFKLNVFSLDFSYLMPLAHNNPLARTLRFTLGFEFDSHRSAAK